MVKNRNFQVRVEESAARRKESKDWKRRSKARRQFKVHAQELVQQLDRLLEAKTTIKTPVELLQHLTLHVWTDRPGIEVVPIAAAAAVKETHQVAAEENPKEENPLEELQEPSEDDNSSIYSSSCASASWSMGTDQAASATGGTGDDTTPLSPASGRTRSASFSSVNSNTSASTRRRRSSGKASKAVKQKGRSRAVSLGNSHDHLYVVHDDEDEDYQEENNDHDNPKEMVIGQENDNEEDDYCMHPVSQYTHRNKQTKKGRPRSNSMPEHSASKNYNAMNKYKGNTSGNKKKKGSQPQQQTMMSSSSPNPNKQQPKMMSHNGTTDTAAAANPFILGDQHGLLCCRTQFFKGHCHHSNASSCSGLGSANSSKKNKTKSSSATKAAACSRYIHHDGVDHHDDLHLRRDQMISLCQIIKPSKNPATKDNPDTESDYHTTRIEQELFLSQQASVDALPEALQETDPDAMEMLYHARFPIWESPSPQHDNAADAALPEESLTTITTSQRICRQLQDCNINLASITYASLGGILVYDRNRDGWLLPSCSSSSSGEKEESDLMFWACVTSMEQQQEETGNHNSNNNHISTLDNSTNVGPSTPVITTTTTTPRDIWMRRRQESIGSEYSQDDLRDIALVLPAIVLEHVLTFLPDAAVAIVSQVCRSWNREIGQNSPSLWQYLLERHDWPLPEEGVGGGAVLSTTAAAATTTSAESTGYTGATSSTGSEPSDDFLSASIRATTKTELYRTAFVGHYTMVRNARAIKAGLAAILKNKKQSGADCEREMAYQDFSCRRHAPAMGNECAKLQIWSESRVLAAYGLDCTLRLFETTRNSSGESIVCRELVCQRVDPYRNTKRKTCTLEAMALDDKFIVSLCREDDTELEAIGNLMIVMTREAFLVGSKSEPAGGGHGGGAGTAATEENYKVINVGETLLEFLMANPETMDPNCLQQLLQFMDDGGELEEVEVSASRSLAPLGNGLFLFEVGIFYPDASVYGPIFMERKMVIISAHSDAIVWVGDSVPDTLSSSRFMVDKNDEVTISCYSDHAMSPCTVAFTAPKSSLIYVGKTGHNGSGSVMDISTIDTSQFGGMESTPKELLGFSKSSNCRLVVNTRTDVVCADLWFKTNPPDPYLDSRTVLSFYAYSDANEEWSRSTLMPTGNLTPRHATTLDDNHLLVLCTQLSCLQVAETQGDDTRTTTDWLSVTREFDHVAIVIDIASRREIHRERWIQTPSFHSGLDGLRCVPSTGDGTMAVALGWKGIVMTGDDVRHAFTRMDGSQGDFGCLSPRSSKKKKKSKTPGSSKKDGYVRGKRMYF